jgi:hypothetical protein
VNLWLKKNPAEAAPPPTCTRCRCAACSPAPEEASDGRLPCRLCGSHFSVGYLAAHLERCEGVAPPRSFRPRFVEVKDTK